MAFFSIYAGLFFIFLINCKFSFLNFWGSQRTCCFVFFCFYTIFLWLDLSTCCFYRFESVYLDEDIRVVKDIRGDFLVVDRAPYDWKEWRAEAFAVFHCFYNCEFTLFKTSHLIEPLEQTLFGVMFYLGFQSRRSHLVIKWHYFDTPLPFWYLKGGYSLLSNAFCEQWLANLSWMCRNVRNIWGSNACGFQ